MKIKESGENYLEAILVLSNNNDHVRAVDICNYFGFSRPTVSAAIKQYKAEGFINVDENNFITLADDGLAIAKKIYEKHQVIAKILMSVGVKDETAYADACKIEHDLSDESFYALKRHFSFK